MRRRRRAFEATPTGLQALTQKHLNFTFAVIPLLLGGLCLLCQGSAPTASPPSNAHGGYDWQKWRQYWAFQPVRRPVLPEVSNEQWARNPVDRFVLAQLEEQGLEPAKEADKATLIRRATFDLTGLPPTPQEIRAFLADKSPVAYERLIDRLLASPHYGEQWGRHWLDIARYVQGRISFLGIKNTLGDQAYRDYVVRAFNQDKPYDRFVMEQLAGDLLPPSGDQQQEFDQVIAPAFLSIGAWFDQETDPNRLKLEMIDDVINTTGQGMLGLTVACARCHDHKFDPIPTSDYYALAGIFGSTRIVGDLHEFWRDGRQRLLRPLAMPDQVAENEAILKQIDAAKAHRWKMLSERHARLLAHWQSQKQQYRNAAAKLNRPFITRWAAENFSGEHNLRIAQLALDGRSVDVIESLMPTEQFVVYKVQVPADGQYRLEALYSTDDSTPINVFVNGANVCNDAFSSPTGGWELTYQQWADVATFDLRRGLNFIRLETKKGAFPRLDRFRLIRVEPQSEQKAKELAASEHLDPQVLANLVNDPQQPWPTIGGIVPYLSQEDRQEVARIDQQIAVLEVTVKPYPTVVSVADQKHAADCPVHIRGDVYNVSKEPVPRGVLHLLDNVFPAPKIAPNESGRLELARWITDKRNPLTPRVMVNRIWQWNFGRGIVGTPSNFGSLGERPTIPQLLDWLAAEFMDHNWSIKHIQRLILTSSTYRLSSAASREAIARDPENKFLSHISPKRLEVESLYDAMASTTNIIVRQESGKPLDVEKDKNRAMYVLSSNRSPKGLGGEVRKMFELFDYDGSGVPIAVRPQSTTPAQALFWLNSPLVNHFADRFAARLLKMDRLDDTKRIEMAYLLALGRSPSRQETSEATDYLKSCTNDQKMDRHQAWTSLCQALYGTVEFRYVE
jgi:hypothetical protein